MVASLHILMLLLALRATGVISHKALPLPVVLSTMIIASPVQPVLKQKPMTTQALPPQPQAAIAAPDLPAVNTAITVTETVPVATTITAPTIVSPPLQQTATTPLTEASFDAAYLNNPAPAYPLLSRRNGEAGKVLLLVQVSKQGAATQVEIKQSCGFARLDEAALEAVRKWRFVPARRGEEAIAASVVVPLTFKINS